MIDCAKLLCMIEINTIEIKEMTSNSNLHRKFHLQNKSNPKVSLIISHIVKFGIYQDVF